MGILLSATHRHRIVLLLLSGALALLTVLVITWASAPPSAAAQISPLSPLTVATPATESQPQVVTPDAVSPTPAQADSNRSPEVDLNRSTDQPLISLGDPAQAQASLILVGALLVGLVVLVIVVIVRRRE